MTAKLCAIVMIGVAAAVAAPRAIDVKASTMTVYVGKSGAFSALGHDHTITAPIASGQVDTAAHSVELRIDAAALRVQDPKASQGDRTEVQSKMAGPEVLDVERHREILFRSTAAEQAGTGAWKVAGSLTLHGQTKAVVVTVREQNGRYVGSATVRQTDFGITPIKVAGGAVKVKDEVRIEFDIRLEAERK